MDQELAPVRAEDNVLGSADVPAAGRAIEIDQTMIGARAIDIGPFVRQEGRRPFWEKPVPSHREDVISRIRLELGLPSSVAEGGIRLAVPQQQPRHIAAWMVGLVQRIRHPE